ncbi:hypothetical protein ACHAWF_009192 [Thalassiosira exigua]
MKSKVRRRGVLGGVSGGGGGGGIVVEASSRKARRKEGRLSKKRRKRAAAAGASAADDDAAAADRSDDAAAEPPREGERAGRKRRRARDEGDGEGGGGEERKVRFSDAVEERTIPSVKNRVPTGLKKSSRGSPSSAIPDDDDDDDGARPREKTARKDRYGRFDDATAAALRRDDAEIAYFESSLGISKGTKGGKKNDELNREYAKNEGYGDDFGDFLMGLDELVDRVGGGDEDGDEDDESDGGGGRESGGEDDSDEGEGVEFDGKYGDDDEDDGHSDGNEDADSQGRSARRPSDGKGNADSEGRSADPYARLDDATALALRNDDAEIAGLERKLGMASSKKGKAKLDREFAKSFEGYGEDFGEFLDGLDRLGDEVALLAGTGGEGGGSAGSDASSMESDDDGGEDDGDDDHNNGERNNEMSSDGSSSEDSDGSEEDDPAEAADHDVALTYRPTSGEDIYGNKIDASQGGAAKPSKYVPPHLRKKLARADSDEVGGGETDGAKAPGASSAAVDADPDAVRLIQRSLNNALNRLSDQTLESVSKSIASLYSQHPFRDVNDCLWKTIRTACVPRHMAMHGLIPLYVGAAAGAHWLGGDGIQLGGMLVERSVAGLVDAAKASRDGKRDDREGTPGGEAVDKEASNFLLIVCYLYNYGVVHCALIYDLVRDFAKHFAEVDVEALLLVLSHCGRQLRSDDPSALKEIVLLVKERAQEAADGRGGDGEGNDVADSSRVQYMMDAIVELKNNKPRKQDATIREKTNVLKKCVGRVKSSAARSLSGKRSGSCLRVTLRDLLDAETKGRWWAVGASWTGNQHRKQLLWGEQDGEDKDEARDEVPKDRSSSSSKGPTNDEEDGLLALASSQRMNTDARRSAFCVVMGSSDCDDAFEKLVRRGILRPKAERDVVRVLVHCCGEERAFNPFYAHLAARICEYHSKSKFTLTLAFWDVMKQLDAFSARKVANLAKLMAHLLGGGEGQREGPEQSCLTIGVLKRIEFSPSDMPEMLIVFLSVCLTCLFESCNNKSIRNTFSHGGSNPKKSKSKRKSRDDESDGDDDGRNGNVQMAEKQDLNDLRESLSLFLMQYLASSPKNVEGSTFHTNYLAALASCESSNKSPA